MASVTGRLWFACVPGLKTWAIISAHFMIKNRYAE
jgi:hypothetical protein